MLTKNFVRAATQNIGNSFLFGFGTKWVTQAFTTGPKGYKIRFPDLYDLRACLRTGREFAKHALVYSCNLLVLERVGLPSFILHLSATFLTGFVLALKNGTSEASKKAAISSVTTFLKSLFSRK